MRIAHVDLSRGASGDKFLGALIDLSEKLGFLNRKNFCEIFENMLPEVKIEIHEEINGGMRGLKVDVIEANAVDTNVVETSNVEANTIEANNVSENNSLKEYSHPHRHWNEIKAMIEKWANERLITQGAFRRSMSVFSLIANAEAKVHGILPEEVCFHEVGALDSIVDVVGSSILFDGLEIEKLYGTQMTVGYGSVECAHGVLSVPAPATAEICTGLKITAGAYEGEMTTPTGAAIAKANITNWQVMPPIIPEAVGIGQGSRVLEGISNNLRIIIGQKADEIPTQSKWLTVEQCALLQTNIDHISAEDCASACEEILASGALDVWQNSISMKKGRLAIELNVLCKVEDIDLIAEKIHKTTGSLGVRRRIVERTVTDRKIIEVQTRFGNVDFKLSDMGDKAERSIWIRPEHDEVERISRENDLSLDEVTKQLEEDFWINSNKHYDN